MFSLTGAQRRAEDFASSVDGPAAPTRPVDAHPDADSHLLDLVAALREVGQETPAPRADFAAELRVRLMAEAQRTAGAPSSSFLADQALALAPRRRGARERRLAVAAASFALIGGTAGMAAAAQDALPGDALYPIKRGLEIARTDLTRGEAPRGKALLDRAGERLAEFSELAVAGAAAGVLNDSAASFEQQAREGADLLLLAYAESSEASTVEALRTFAAETMTEVAVLTERAPLEVRAQLVAIASVAQQLDDQAVAACPQCALLPDLQAPTVLVPAIEATRAIARLEARDGVGVISELDNSHPPVNVAPGAEPAPKVQPDTAPGTAGGPETEKGPKAPIVSPNPTDVLPGLESPPLPVDPAPKKGADAPKVNTGGVADRAEGSVLDPLLNPLLP